MRRHFKSGDCPMKSFAMSLAVLALSVPALAQDRTVSENYMQTLPVVAAPTNGDIILKIGDPARIYFKHPIKSVRLDDEFSVKAIPQSEHIIVFTGLAPGHSSLAIEGTDGRETRWGLVTVVSEPHVVKIYMPSKVNRLSGELRKDSVDASGFVSIHCNEIGCDPR
jgi:hypothetical protein